MQPIPRRQCTRLLLGPLMLVVAVVLICASGCHHQPETPHRSVEPNAPGAAVVGRYQCNRRHRAAGKLVAPPRAKNCSGCHNAVLDGEYDWKLWEYSPARVAEWKRRIHDLVEVPTLTGADKRFRRDWLVQFLQHPHDLRPRLGATMPRFSMPEKDARAIAAYLVTDKSPYPPGDLTGADAKAGRAIMEAMNCGFCHTFSGVQPLHVSARPQALVDEHLSTAQVTRAMKLAPDFRYTRERMSPAAILAWLRNPRAIKPDTLMPRFELSASERKNVAAYILHAELAPKTYPRVPKRLPVLHREVHFPEVEARVFRRVCWHCHSDPAGNGGDGGPGNTGGFGFAGRGLDLSSYEGIMRGRVNNAGERESVLAPLADGTPRIVAHMMARYRERAGKPVEGIRGMPLGLPPMSLKQIQLVETWIAQGAKR